MANACLCGYKSWPGVNCLMTLIRGITHPSGLARIALWPSLTKICLIALIFGITRSNGLARIALRPSLTKICLMALICGTNAWVVWRRLPCDLTWIKFTLWPWFVGQMPNWLGKNCLVSWLGLNLPCGLDLWDQCPSGLVKIILWPGLAKICLMTLICRTNAKRSNEDCLVTWPG